MFFITKQSSLLEKSHFYVILQIFKFHRISTRCTFFSNSYIEMSIWGEGGDMLWWSLSPFQHFLNLHCHLLNSRLSSRSWRCEKIFLSYISKLTFNHLAVRSLKYTVKKNYAFELIFTKITNFLIHSVA